jgi:hypothetical protein
MTTIQIFDPAMCCSTGVCGVEADQDLARFAADVEWVRRNGARIERFNLAQEPMAFVNQPVVKEALERLGQPSLPLTLVDGDIQCSGRYPSRDELATWAGTLSAQPAVRPEAAALLKRSSTCCSSTKPADPSRTGCCG